MNGQPDGRTLCTRSLCLQNLYIVFTGTPMLLSKNVLLQTKLDCNDSNQTTKFFEDDFRLMKYHRHRIVWRICCGPIIAKGFLSAIIPFEIVL